MNTREKQRFSRLIHELLARIDEENARAQQGQAVVTLDQQSVGRLSR